MALRFLVLFALTNTSAVGAVSAYLAGGWAWTLFGLLLSLLALAGFTVIARIVILARPVARLDAAERRRLREHLKEATQ